MMRKIRLLILDNHAAVRHALVTRLRSSPNIEVIGSRTALAEAVAAEAARAPDVAILGLNGRVQAELRQVLDLVKQLTAQGTAVLALTSYVDDLQQELFLRAGASGFLLKDINTPQLLAAIEQAAAAGPAPP